MKHFLITRFNVHVKNWKVAKDGKPVLTEEWLEHRFGLFEKYCFPSVQNQTSKNFRWIVVLNNDTPDKYRKRINDIASELGIVVVLYVNGKEELIPRLQKCIRSNLNEDDYYIITTRLDNDDALHRDFVGTVQDLIEPTNKSLLIDFRKGYQLNLQKERCDVRLREMHYNPFLSLVENIYGFETIYSRKHKEWELHTNVKIYDDEPMWVQVVHEKNKTTSLKRKLPLVKFSGFEEFGFKHELEVRCLMGILFFNLGLICKKYIYSLFIRG